MGLNIKGLFIVIVIRVSVKTKKIEIRKFFENGNFFILNYLCDKHSEHS